MRIYNGTKKTLTLPYTGGEMLTIPPKTPSGHVLCSPEFLSTVITAYNTDEIAVIASGPFEISACANVPTAVNYVVQSLDEAIARFNPDAKKIQEQEKEKKAESVKLEEPPVPSAEPVTEEPKLVEPEVAEPVKEEPAKKEKKAKKDKEKAE